MKVLGLSQVKEEGTLTSADWVCGFRLPLIAIAAEANRFVRTYIFELGLVMDFSHAEEAEHHTDLATS